MPIYAGDVTSFRGLAEAAGVRSFAAFGLVSLTCAPRSSLLANLMSFPTLNLEIFPFNRLLTSG
jgi:hypothetical protein